MITGEEWFRVREAREDETTALAALHVQTFNEAHGAGRSGGPSFELRQRQWQEAFAARDGTWFCFVAEDSGGELIGFAKGTPHDGGVPGFGGELNKIYVLGHLHRRGIGRRLVCCVAHRFLERGVASMLLFGDASSPSNGFYEKLGAERIYSPTGDFHGGYGWRDLHLLASQCACR